MKSWREETKAYPKKREAIPEVAPWRSIKKSLKKRPQ
jgi:hypothetical protein